MLKRILDLIGSLTGIVIFFIPMLLIALIVRLTMGAPVLFRHTRPGLNSKPFILYKFRSMNDLRDRNNNLLAENQRITSFGRFLRNTSLDELPELINILKGEISLVGPRPLMMEYLPLYNKEQIKRHDVKPGLTGWAQVNGRNAISWEKKFELDIWYVNHHTLLIDLKIILMTVTKVLKSEGINSNENLEMHPFTGSDDNVKN